MFERCSTASRCFAHRGGVDISEVLARFPGATHYLETTAGELRGAGFGVHATGTNPERFDVQLFQGRSERGALPADADLLLAAQRLVDAAGEARSNPSYAGPEHGEQE